MTDPSAGIGRRRRLARLAGLDGVISGIAIDHRDSLRTILEERGLGSAGPAELQALKRALTLALAPAATALMLDLELGRLALQSGAVPDSIGLIMPLEAQGYEALGDGRSTTLLDDFSDRPRPWPRGPTPARCSCPTGPMTNRRPPGRTPSSRRPPPRAMPSACRS